MVSKNPNPPEGFYLDPSGLALPGLGLFASSTAASASSSEDPSKKVRKPYTITKSRESWTEPEHDKFLEALQLFDRDWKKIEAFLGQRLSYRCLVQIRSHAQKYFLKVQKNGANEHLPPPRPKKKAAHPYPHKASKTGLSQTSGSTQSPVALTEPGFIMRPDSSSILMSPVPSCNMSSWTMNSVQTVNSSQGPKAAIGANNCCSSHESHPRARPTKDTIEQGNNSNPLRVLPDFTQVYTFIGSIFDPNTRGHLQKLKKMDPIDVETVLLLMRNLSINITSPVFEDHRRLLSSSEKVTMNPIPLHESHCSTIDIA